MADLLDFVVKLSLDDSEVTSGISNLGGTIKSGLGTAVKIGGAAVAATTAAIAGGTAALVKGTASVAEYGDNIDKMSQKMGISAEAYQEWDAVLQHSGANISSLKGSMKTLAKQAQSNADEFKTLGISEQEVASLSQEDLFAKVITGLQNMEEGTERTTIATKLLGRGGTELGALLNTSAEETQAMRDRVHELGGVMSDDAVKASAKFQDTLQDMSTGFDGLKRNMMSEFLPSITTVMEGMTNIFTGEDDLGLDKISEGITGFIDKATNVLPRVLDLGMRIVTSLGEGIIQNLPAIADAAINIIGQLGDFILQNLPTLMTVGVQILLSIANSLSENLPTMIPAIVSVILQIVEILVDNAPMLIDAAISIITALAEGLIQALPVLIAQAPVIITKLLMAIVQAVPQLIEASVKMIDSIVQGITDNLPQIIQAGIQIIISIVAGLIQSIPELIGASFKLITAIQDAFRNVNWLELGINIIKGIISGIASGVGALVDSVKNAAKKALDGAKSFLGIKSPSKVFKDSVGKMIDLGMAEGIEGNTDYVERAMGDLEDATQISPAIDVQQPVLEYAGGYGMMEEIGNSMNDSRGGYEDVVTAVTDALMNMQLIVNIGNRPIEAMITSAQQRTTYRSGGR